MLISRATTARLLGCSVDHVRKLQGQGALGKIYRHSADPAKILDQTSRSTAYCDAQGIAKYLHDRARKNDVHIGPSIPITDEELDRAEQRIVAMALLILKVDRRLDVLVDKMFADLFESLEGTP